ncbi:c-type cytochrome [Variovorax terrae]|uniref:C-type cytochrome n=1 Tax=Variovorax terrae TaxID=2923278 RepID=A0A9X2ANB1_9BURK|nr:c-type cytochrome [Variovorax terrae]MCJ0763595.1 c-type cytochrome [Variovorax terrae]
MSLTPSLQLLAAGALALAFHSGHAQDAAAGKTAFAQCAACHSIDGSNGAGPSLQGIDGRKAGIFPGFRYSRAMKAAGYAWDEKTLDAYLADPQKAIPGNVMPFSGVSDAKQRADLVAYLKTLK